jgi:hypothetical protein
MKLNYPSITQFQQLIELKDYRPPTKKEYVPPPLRSYGGQVVTCASWPSISSVTRPCSSEALPDRDETGRTIAKCSWALTLRARDHLSNHSDLTAARAPVNAILFSLGQVIVVPPIHAASA